MRKFLFFVLLALSIISVAVAPAAAQEPVLRLTNDGCPLEGEFYPDGTTAVDLTGKYYTCTAGVWVPDESETLVLVEDDENEFGELFTIVGAPEEVEMPPHDVARDFRIGMGTEYFISEPGGLTSDPGDLECRANPVCWWISPDNQFKLTDRESEVVDLREDAWVFMTFAGGTLEIEGTVITLEKLPLHNWVVVLRGQAPGDGDRNVDVVVTDYDPGFALATNVPVSARLSEDYFDQNVANTYDLAGQPTDVCAGGCESNSALFYSVQNGGWVVIHQDGYGAPWELVDTNVTNGVYPGGNIE